MKSLTNNMASQQGQSGIVSPQNPNGTIFPIATSTPVGTATTDPYGTPLGQPVKIRDPITGGLIDNPAYVAGGGGSAAGTPTSPLAETNTNTPQPVPQYSDIYSQQLSQAQQEITGIQNYYKDLINKEDTAHQGRQAKIDAMIASGEVAGSAASTATTQAESDLTAKNEAVIRNQQAQAIAGIYQNVETNTQNLLQTETGDVTKQNEQIKSDTMGYLDKAATAGITSSMLKQDAQLWNNLQQQTGFSDYQLQTYLDSNPNNPNKPITSDTYFSDAQGNAVLRRVTVDTKTGQKTEQDFQLDQPFSQISGAKTFTNQSDGSLWAPDESGNYSINITPKAQGKATNVGTSGQVYVPGKGIVSATPVTSDTSQGININTYGIKATSTTSGFGGVDSGVAAKDGGTFLTSQGDQQDRQIAQKLLTSNIYSDLTVDSALKKWSNDGYGGSNISGVDPQALIKDLQASN